MSCLRLQNNCEGISPTRTLYEDFKNFEHSVKAKIEGILVSAVDYAALYLSTFQWIVFG